MSATATPAFVVKERFGPQAGESWVNYLEWAGLPQLKELVSLDQVLCPNVIEHLEPSDWDHNIQADYLINYFTDLPYLLERARPTSDHNVLAVWQNPKAVNIIGPPVQGFTLCGFDLIELQTQISALSNCGGFPLAFQNNELNPLGLFDRLDRAEQVADELRRQYPDEAHADCDVWAIWRRAG